MHCVASWEALGQRNLSAHGMWTKPGGRSWVKKSWESGGRGRHLQDDPHNPGADWRKPVPGLPQWPAWSAVTGRKGTGLQGLLCQGLCCEEGALGILLQERDGDQHQHVRWSIPPRLQASVSWWQGEQTRWPLPSPPHALCQGQVLWAGHQAHQGQGHLPDKDHPRSPHSKSGHEWRLRGAPRGREMECVIKWRHQPIWGGTHPATMPQQIQMQGNLQRMWHLHPPLRVQLSWLLDCWKHL